MKELPAAKDEPEQFSVEEEDGGGHNPSDNGREPGVRKLTHLAAVGGELNQRDDREGQLKTQNDLAENEKRGDFAFSGDADDQNSGQHSQRAGDEAAQPGLKANLQKPFHDNLARKSSGEGGVLTGGEERASEKSAGEAHAQDGTEKFVGI